MTAAVEILLTPKSTRRTTEYDKRSDGWRYVKTTEVEVESQHSCARDSKPFREPRTEDKPLNLIYPRVAQ